MPTLVSRTSGNFTDASSWATADSASLLNAEVSTSTTVVAFTSGSQFTPGAITIDGIGVKVSTRNSTVGTASVRLVTGGAGAGSTTGTAVAGTTVTINVNDVSSSPGGWVFFRFAAPVTLVAATLYNVQINTSTATAWTYFRDATASNLSRFLRTTTTAAPAATDPLIITGERTAAAAFSTNTITMNNTASTSFGSTEVTDLGILTFETNAATAYQLRLAGNLILCGDSIFQMGTALTPIPASSSARLEFIVVANVDFGLIQRGNSTFTTFGAAKVGRAYLAADAAVADTTITTNVSTGWLNGDTIALASTTRIVANTEDKNLTSNATGTSVSVTALTSAHSGTGNIAGEIINLTRNVKIIGQSTTLQTYVFLSNFGINSINNTEFAFIGSAVTGRRGVGINTTTGSVLISGCAFRNFEVVNSIGINLIQSSATNISISDCVIYRTNLNAIRGAASTSLGVSLTDVWAFTTLQSNQSVFNFFMQAATLSGLVAVGAITGGNGFTFNSSLTQSNYSINNLIAHSNSVAGFSLISPCTGSSATVFNNLTAWRNGTRGVQFSTNCSNIQIIGGSMFGNTNGGIFLTSAGLNSDILLKNLVINAGTTLTQPAGIEIQGGCSQIYVEDCTFGATTTHATGDIVFAAANTYAEVYFRNCLFGSSTEFSGNTTNLVPESTLASTWHDQVVGDNRLYTRSGIVSKDTSVFDVGPASMRMTPNSSTLKLVSPDKRVIVPSGRTVKISVKVRWSSTSFGDAADFNGNTNGVRLWQKRNPTVGLMSDVLLDTLLVAPNSPFGLFQLVTGTTAAVTSNGVVEFYLDINGTAGFINADTWSVEIL